MSLCSQKNTSRRARTSPARQRDEFCDAYCSAYWATYRVGGQRWTADEDRALYDVLLVENRSNWMCTSNLFDTRISHLHGWDQLCIRLPVLGYPRRSVQGYQQHWKTLATEVANGYDLAAAPAGSYRSHCRECRDYADGAMDETDGYFYCEACWKAYENPTFPARPLALSQANVTAAEAIAAAAAAAPSVTHPSSDASGFSPALSPTPLLGAEAALTAPAGAGAIAIAEAAAAEAAAATFGTAAAEAAAATFEAAATTFEAAAATFEAGPIALAAVGQSGEEPAVGLAEGPPAPAAAAAGSFVAPNAIRCRRLRSLTLSAVIAIAATCCQIMRTHSDAYEARSNTHMGSGREPRARAWRGLFTDMTGPNASTLNLHSLYWHDH